MVVIVNLNPNRPRLGAFASIRHGWRGWVVATCSTLALDTPHEPPKGWRSPMLALDPARDFTVKQLPTQKLTARINPEALLYTLSHFSHVVYQCK